MHHNFKFVTTINWQVAGETLRSNITILGRQLLPYTEMIMYAVSILKKKYLDKSTEIYVPNFKSVVQHFCLPASGKPIIREIGKGLKLGEREIEAASMTLHRFGNQSSSSLWYELSYIEAKERVKKGDKVWQLGMGSGPKCNSLVWECIRPIIGEAPRGVWADTIDDYPSLAFAKNWIWLAPIALFGVAFLCPTDAFDFYYYSLLPLKMYASVWLAQV